MDKKEIGNALLFIVFMIILILSIFGLYVFFNSINNSYTSACISLGYEEFHNMGNFQFCEDYNNNLHSVKIKCDNSFIPKCSAKNIQINDFTNSNILNNSAMKGGKE